MRYRYFTVLSLGLAFILAGCSGAKETLGLEKSVPDEFAVVKRAPLSLPPDYTLRPPRPGTPRPQEQTVAEEAQQTVFGKTLGTADQTVASGESILLQKTGATSADPNIRNKVDAETAEFGKVDNRPPVQKFLNIGGKNVPTANVVDAKKEVERILTNLEDGKPLTEGETPSIENKTR